MFDLELPLPACQRPDIARRALQSTVRKAVFGRNEEAKYLIDCGVANVLVDDREIGGSFRGAPVVGFNSLTKDDLLINCSTSVSPLDVHDYLNSGTSAVVVHYSDLCHYRPDLFKLPKFVKEFRAEFASHGGFYHALMSDFSDDESRSTLASFIRYRGLFELSAMKDYRVRLSDQYFEPFINLTSAHIVDGGGFDGDTSEEIAKRYPDFATIHFFEPSRVNIERAKARLTNLQKILFYEFALSDVPGILSFDPNAGSASQVAVDGGGSVDVSAVRLDDVLPGPVDFIKLDLEGWELRALQGADRIIREWQPKLAIAIYHEASDLRNIVTWLRAAYSGTGLDLYLRHYTQGWSETILYVVPKQIQKLRSNA